MSKGTGEGGVASDCDCASDSSGETSTPRSDIRELRLTMEYDRGVKPVMDVLIDNPELEAHSVESCAGRDRAWRVERFSGPAEALDRLDFLRFDEAGHEEMTEVACGSSRSHYLLDAAPNARAYYTYWEGLNCCYSVLGNAARYLDHGMVLQSTRSGRFHEWRLIIRSEQNVPEFFESIETHLRDGVAISLERLTDAETWSIDSLTSVSLPREQQEVLRTAHEAGYYETPREATVSDLAEELDVPSSTVSYRLRRAEAQLASGFFDDHGR